MTNGGGCCTISISKGGNCVPDESAVVVDAELFVELMSCASWLFDPKAAVSVSLPERTVQAQTAADTSLLPYLHHATQSRSSSSQINHSKQKDEG